MKIKPRLPKGFRVSDQGMRQFVAQVSRFGQRLVIFCRDLSAATHVWETGILRHRHSEWPATRHQVKAGQ
jgi:hypothetical protein